MAISTSAHEFGEYPNTITIPSALQVVEESYTCEISLYKKCRLLEIIVGAPATANDVLDPEVVQVRGSHQDRPEKVNHLHHRCAEFRLILRP